MSSLPCLLLAVISAILFVDESLIYSHALQRKEESGALCR